MDSRSTGTCGCRHRTRFTIPTQILSKYRYQVFPKWVDDGKEQYPCYPNRTADLRRKLLPNVDVDIFKPTFWMAVINKIESIRTDRYFRQNWRSKLRSVNDSPQMGNSSISALKSLYFSVN